MLLPPWSYSLGVEGTSHINVHTVAKVQVSLVPETVLRNDPILVSPQKVSGSLRGPSPDPENQWSRSISGLDQYICLLEF